MISKYEKEILIKETNLFCNWYVKENLKKKRKNFFQ